MSGPVSTNRDRPVAARAGGPRAWLVLAPGVLALVGFAVVTDVRGARSDVELTRVHAPDCASVGAGAWPPEDLAGQANAAAIGALILLVAAAALTVRHVRRQPARATRALLALALVVLPVVVTAVAVTTTDATAYRHQLAGLAATCAAGR